MKNLLYTFLCMVLIIGCTKEDQVVQFNNKDKEVKAASFTVLQEDKNSSSSKNAEPQGWTVIYPTSAANQGWLRVGDVLGNVAWNFATNGYGIDIENDRGIAIHPNRDDKAVVFSFRHRTGEATVQMIVDEIINAPISVRGWGRNIKLKQYFVHPSVENDELARLVWPSDLYRVSNPVIGGLFGWYRNDLLTDNAEHGDLFEAIHPRDINLPRSERRSFILRLHIRYLDGEIYDSRFWIVDRSHSWITPKGWGRFTLKEIL